MIPGAAWGAIALAAAAACLAGEAPWPLTAGAMLPALMWAPGSGWVRRFDRQRPGTPAHRFVDGCWIAMLLTSVDVALIREVGLTGAAVPWALWGTAAAWWGLGQVVGRAGSAPTRASLGERIGVGCVLVAVVGVGLWRAADLTRGLDGYWYLDRAAEHQADRLDVEAGEGWSQAAVLGWEGDGVRRLSPGPTGEGTLRSAAGATGTVVLVAQGPVGTSISAAGQTATVARSMTEHADEGPVRRYVDRGSAAIAVPVDLDPGAGLGVATDADTVYLLQSGDAVWALHASGVMRFVHYYQILNQVENLVWAQELLTTRRFTWNQPPGWSPLLAAANATIHPDMQGAGALFLWVLVVVGLTSVRLAAVIAPGAPPVAFAVPGGMTAAHGLLMLEPASFNFPDSLYAGSVLAVGLALASARPGWFAGLGAAAQALRWPGAVVATLLAGAWWVARRVDQRRALAGMWSLIALGGLVAGLAVLSGDADDLLFILYFETFPEHWHGDYEPTTLASRIPGFYAMWLYYTGGGVALALAAAAFGRPGTARSSLRALLGAVLLYSVLLCTIDHHPTHYVLPLVAMTGPAVVAAAAAVSQRALAHGITALTLSGLGIFLWRSQVW